MVTNLWIHGANQNVINIREDCCAFMLRNPLAQNVSNDSTVPARKGHTAHGQLLAAEGKNKKILLPSLMGKNLLARSMTAKHLAQ